MPHDFSIAAVHPSTTANAKKNVGLSNSHLISALLQAAVAFSTSQQLSEQLLSSGVMSPVALLLNRGGVHNRHNSQVVELLWNLLEACPLYDAHTKNSHAAANSALAAWHSQILKPRQKTTDPKQAAAIFGEGQGGNDSNDQVSTGRPGDTASADVEVQQQDDDAQANGKYGDAACTLASTAGEGCTQELQEPCAACPADYSISAAGSPAGTETASATPAATGDVTTAGDAADTAEEGAPGPTLDSGCAPAESCLSAESNSQTCASRDTSPSASASQDHQSAADEPGKSAVAGCEEAATIGLTAEVGVVEEVAIGISRVLADCLEHGYSTADKELRNTVLVVAGMLAQSRRYRNAFCRLEMLQQLLVTSTEPELGDCSTACFRVRCTLTNATGLYPSLRCPMLCCAYAKSKHAEVGTQRQAPIYLVSKLTHGREIGCMRMSHIFPDC